MVAKGYRYHIPPFYTIPQDGQTDAVPESMRDHAWIPRMAASSAIHAIRMHAAAHSESEPVDSDSDVDIPGMAGATRSSSPVSTMQSAPSITFALTRRLRSLPLRTRHHQQAEMACSAPALVATAEPQRQGHLAGLLTSSPSISFSCALRCIRDCLSRSRSLVLLPSCVVWILGGRSSAPAGYYVATVWLDLQRPLTSPPSPMPAISFSS